MPNTSAQGLRQGLMRTATGKALSYNGDFLARFDQLEISADGGFNGRLLTYINEKLGTEHTSLPSAMAAMAAENDATNFSAMNTFTA